MPYISSPDDGTQIWYELVDELKEAESGGAGAGAEASPSASSPQGGGGSSSTSDDGAAAAAAKPTLSRLRRKRPRLVFIMGMGATSGCWGPQVDALAKSGVRAQALLLDNRGVGKSGSPRSKKSYSTTTMARDVLACMVSVAVSPCFWARFWALFLLALGCLLCDASIQRRKRGGEDKCRKGGQRGAGKRMKLKRLPALRFFSLLLPDSRDFSSNEGKRLFEREESAVSSSLSCFSWASPTLRARFETLEGSERRKRAWNELGERHLGSTEWPRAASRKSKKRTTKREALLPL